MTRTGFRIVSTKTCTPRSNSASMWPYRAPIGRAHPQIKHKAQWKVLRLDSSFAQRSPAKATFFFCPWQHEQFQLVAKDNICFFDNERRHSIANLLIDYQSLNWSMEWAVRGGFDPAARKLQQNVDWSRMQKLKSSFDCFHRFSIDFKC